MPQSRQYLFWILLFCLSLRLISLGFPDLLDPTESRYAAIAQQMVLSGDWVVPKVHIRGVIEPYLGKPPLHFWLTSGAFSVLGINEFAARLPSFLATLVAIASIMWLSTCISFAAAGNLASILLCSSLLFFFMAGASVVDVTLAGCTAISFAAAWRIFGERQSNALNNVLLFSGLALGFLTKGPISILLVGTPVGIWLLYTKQLRAVLSIKWLLGIGCFLLITVPWFIAAEKQNPGFLQYFFINENFGRYLFRHYGDKYGTGHRYLFGSIWGMWVGAFLPWIVPVLIEVWRQRKQFCERQFWSERPALLFSLLWAISPCLIFTFAKQLHPAYVLPGIPGLAMFSALLLKESPQLRTEKVYFVLCCILFTITTGMVIAGGVLGATALIVGVTSVLAVIMLLILKRTAKSLSVSAPVLAVISVMAFCATTLSLSQHLSLGQSSKTTLRCIAHFSPEAVPHVGVIDANNNSVYFYTRSAFGTSGKPITVSYHDSAALAPASLLPKDLIFRKNQWPRLEPLLPPEYKPAAAVGRWMWVRASSLAVEVGACPVG